MSATACAGGGVGEENCAVATQCAAEEWVRIARGRGVVRRIPDGEAVRRKRACGALSNHLLPTGGSASSVSLYSGLVGTLAGVVLVERRIFPVGSLSQTAVGESHGGAGEAAAARVHESAGKDASADTPRSHDLRSRCCCRPAFLLRAGVSPKQRLLPPPSAALASSDAR